MIRAAIRTSIFFTLLPVLILSGCAGTVKNMRPVPPGEVMERPEEGKALVVFMRPSTLGFAIQSSVFDVIDGDPQLVGIVAAKKKVGYQVEPGERLFMVVGESADFMSANVEANKTYYTLVTPRMGLWKARFSLEPVRADQLGTDEFRSWYDECEWVEMTPESGQWASANIMSIRSKQNEYYAKWTAKSAADRPVLYATDGRTE